MAKLSSPALHAVFLLTRGCLPLAFNLPKGVVGESPIPGRELTPEERAALGLNGPGATVRYEVDGCDVFLDLAGEQATVWFVEGDFTSAAVLLEEMLAKEYGRGAVQVDAGQRTPGGQTLTQRIVVSPEGNRRLAVISVTFGLPESQGADRMFFARIFPQERMAS